MKSTIEYSAFLALSLLNKVISILLFQLNEIDMKNGREMVTSQKTKNLSNLEKKVKS